MRTEQQREGVPLKKRFRRKDLKRDRFVEEVSHQVEYVSGHRKQVTAAVAVALALLIGGGAYWSYARNKAVASNAALQEAIDLYHGDVTLEERPGMQTFATQAERTERVTRALDGVILNYQGTPAAAGAAYYSGLLDLEQGNRVEAKAHLEQAIRGAGSELPAQARMALGAMLLEDGDSAAAREVLQPVVDNPTRTVTRARATIELARTYVDSDPEEARRILNEVQTEHPPASGMASAVLETLPDGG